MLEHLHNSRGLEVGLFIELTNCGLKTGLVWSNSSSWKHPLTTITHHNDTTFSVMHQLHNRCSARSFRCHVALPTVVSEIEKVSSKPVGCKRIVKRF
jgi:hypothetical protein